MALTEEEFEKLLDRPKKNGLFEDRKKDIERFNLYQPEYKNTDLDRSKWILYNLSNEILFNHTLNEFFLWDGCRWEEDTTLKIIDKIKLGIREIYHECSILEDDRERQKKADFAIKFENLQNINRALELAKSDQNIAVISDDLDPDPWLLNFQNGIYDLKELTFRPHNPDDRITKICDFKYNKNAEAPTWDKFLKRIFDDNQELINFLARAVGYSLTGDTSEQCFFMLYGVGANGKSTFLNTILAMLNNYAAQSDFSTFLVRKVEGPRNDIARLAGVRFCAAIEADSDKRLSESLIKQITGGDRVAVRFLHKEFFEYTPQFKLWLAANHKPTIRDTSHAIWRRVKLIPFTVIIPDVEQDKKLLDKLKSELPGIFNWALTGYKQWRDEGLKFPPDVVSATNQYRCEMDRLGDFIQDCCMFNENAEISSKELYEEYEKWCRDNSEDPISKVQFGRLLSEKGFEKIRGVKQGRGWKGIDINGKINF